MLLRRLALRTVVLLGAVALAVQSAQHAFAQAGVAGVAIDAEGVLHRTLAEDPTGALTEQRRDAAQAALGPELSAPTPLRLVSLNRLERAIRAQVDQQRRPTEEMLSLAGLTRLQFVFFYPETGDIVIGGPAEGWMTDLSGRKVGLKSGRPVLELQDLVVALRAFPPQGAHDGFIGCSIDPTEEGLAAMQQFLLSIGGNAVPGDEQFITEGLRTSLGLQTVRIDGVAATTHFAQVLVEADYRMKLIGIGLERPAVRLVSYVERASPAAVSRNALQRWFFVPDYQCVRASEDRLAMELVGESVRLVGESELVTADGARVEGGSRGDRASQAFTQGFTQKYAELAAKTPVYAQLRNLIDLSVAAAYIQQQGFYDKSDWSADVFLSEQQFPVEILPAPRHVDTVVTSIWKGNRLMTPVGGGVEIEPQLALSSENLLPDENGAVRAAQEALDLSGLAPDQWWWQP